MILGSIVSYLALLLIGGLTGVASAVLGIGGGLIMVPALTMLGIPMVKASATSLVGVLFAALSSSITHFRRDELHWRACLMLSGCGLVTAQFGASTAHHLPERWLSLGFAVLLLSVIPLVDRHSKRLGTREGNCDLSISSPCAWTGMIGLVAGFLSGLFGVGGGVIIVPLLVMLLNNSMKEAVMTSLGAIVIIAISGLAHHALNGHVLWGAGLCLGAGSIVGAQFGSRVLQNMPERRVNFLFRFFCIVLAAYMTILGLG